MIHLSVIDSPLFAFWSPGPAEMMVLAVVALLLYGGKLPDAARSWGKTFAEFRRGLSGFQNDLNEVIYSEPEQIAYRDDSHQANGYEEADDYHYQDHHDDGEGISDSGSDELDGKSPHDDDSPASEIDDSEQTVRNAGTDTVVIEDEQDKPTS